MKVMSKRLAESFVLHRKLILAAQTVTKISLHHREDRFDLNSFVVMVERFFPVVVPFLELLLSDAAAPARVRRLERDHGPCADLGDLLLVPHGVGDTIRDDFADREILPGDTK